MSLVRHKSLLKKYISPIPFGFDAGMFLWYPMTEQSSDSGDIGFEEASQGSPFAPFTDQPPAFDPDVAGFSKREVVDGAGPVNMTYWQDKLRFRPTRFTATGFGDRIDRDDFSIEFVCQMPLRDDGTEIFKLYNDSYYQFSFTLIKTLPNYTIRHIKVCDPTFRSTDYVWLRADMDAADIMHFVWSVKNGQSTVWLNGVEIFSENQGYLKFLDTQQQLDSLTLRAGYAGDSGRWESTLNHVALYSSHIDAAKAAARFAMFNNVAHHNSVVLDKSPEAYWPLDETVAQFGTAYDASGNGYDMTITGGSANYTSGQIPLTPTGRSYDVSAGAALVEYKGTDIMVAGDMSWEVWSNEPELIGNGLATKAVFMFYGTSDTSVAANEHRQMLYVDDSPTYNYRRLFFAHSYDDGGATAEEVIQSSDLPRFEPQYRNSHIVVTRDATAKEYRFYLNGNLISANSYTNDVNAVAAGSRFVLAGSVADTTTTTVSNRTDGETQHPAIYHRVLTPAEISANHEFGAWTDPVIPPD